MITRLFRGGAGCLLGFVAGFLAAVLLVTLMSRLG